MRSNEKRSVSGNEGEGGFFCRANRGSGGKENDVQSSGAFRDVYGADAGFSFIRSYGGISGGMVYGQAQAGTLSNGTNLPNIATQDTEDAQVQDKQEGVTEPPDNELIDFDVF